jgi:histidine ammonia-lyase
LSRNVIVLCVVGVGKPLPEEVVRGMMVIRANMLAKGHSGVRNVRNVLAIELLTAAQVIDLRPEGARRLGQGTARAYAAIRKQIAFLEHDRETASDMSILASLIHSGDLIKEVTEVVPLE